MIVFNSTTSCPSPPPPPTHKYPKILHTLERNQKWFCCNSEFHAFNRSSDSKLTTMFRIYDWYRLQASLPQDIIELIIHLSSISNMRSHGQNAAPHVATRDFNATQDQLMAQKSDSKQPFFLTVEIKKPETETLYFIATRSPPLTIRANRAKCAIHRLERVRLLAGILCHGETIGIVHHQHAQDGRVEHRRRSLGIVHHGIGSLVYTLHGVSTLELLPLYGHLSIFFKCLAEQLLGLQKWQKKGRSQKRHYYTSR